MSVFSRCYRGQLGQSLRVPGLIQSQFLPVAIAGNPQQHPAAATVALAVQKSGILRALLHPQLVLYRPSRPIDRPGVAQTKVLEDSGLIEYPAFCGLPLPCHSKRPVGITFKRQVERGRRSSISGRLHISIGQWLMSGNGPSSSKLLANGSFSSSEVSGLTLSDDMSRCSLRVS